MFPGFAGLRPIDLFDSSQSGHALRRVQGPRDASAGRSCRCLATGTAVLRCPSHHEIPWLHRGSSVVSTVPAWTCFPFPLPLDLVLRFTTRLLAFGGHLCDALAVPSVPVSFPSSCTNFSLLFPSSDPALPLLSQSQVYHVPYFVAHHHHQSVWSPLWFILLLSFIITQPNPFPNWQPLPGTHSGGWRP